MAFKTFPESCSFAALATLLERAGEGEVRDIDVARETHIPWIWKEIEGQPYTGSWIVDNTFLNVAAHAWGRSLRGGSAPNAEMPARLREVNTPTMVSIIWPETGVGHSVVVEWKDGQWEVENIRYAREELAGWTCDDAELVRYLKPETHYGYLVDGISGDIPDLDKLHWDTVEKVFPAYRKRLQLFWEDPHTERALRKGLDVYLRGLILEGPGLLGAIGEEDLQESLARVQFHVFQELGKKAEYTIFATGYPWEKLSRLLDRYEAMLRRGIRSDDSNPPMQRWVEI